MRRRDADHQLTLTAVSDGLMVLHMTGLTFEGQAPKYCFLVFIDGATGRLMQLRFGETESAFDYMMATREYLEQHGKPLAFSSERKPKILSGTQQPFTTRLNVSLASFQTQISSNE